MSSRCPLPDCGFTTDDGEQFNDHMHAHEQSVADERAKHEAELTAIHEGNLKGMRDLEAQSLRAREIESAFNVVAPLVRAVRVLLSDDKMRTFVVETAKDLLREIEQAGTSSGTGADSTGV
jgi:hypothetical protein